LIRVGGGVTFATMKIEIHTKVTGGKLTTNRKLLSDAIAQFEGKAVTLTISRRKKKRSNAQNSWYWGVAIPIIKNALKQAGNWLTEDDTHDLIKMALAKRCPDLVMESIVMPDTGEVIERLRSTTTMTTTEFMEYKMFIQQWAAEVLGVDVPDPNDYEFTE
jgi:hypothetical protein